MRQRFSERQILNAIRDAEGRVSQASSMLGCTKQTIYNYLSRYEKLAHEWDKLREDRHDYVEGMLYDRIRQGDTVAIIFYLKTQAADRGYVRR